MKKRLLLFIPLLLLLAYGSWSHWRRTYFYRVFDYLRENDNEGLRRFIAHNPKFREDMRKFSNRPWDPLVEEARSENPNTEIVRTLCSTAYNSDVPMQALTESIRLNSGAEAFVEILRYANKAQVMLHRVTGGGTLLHYVLTASIHIEKRPVMLGALLDKGVDPYVQDDSGDCFFHIMGKNGQSPEELMAELEVLCSHGVDLNRPNRAGLTFLDIYRKSLEERYKGKTVDSYEESYRTVCSVIRRAQTSTSPKAAQRPSALSKDK